MTINTVFPVPIYENTIDLQLSKDEINFLYQQILGNQVNSHKAMNSFVGYNSNDKILDSPTLSAVKEKIEIEIKKFIKEYSMEPNYWYIGKSWLTVTLPGGRINMHNHTSHGGIISGVIYIDAPQNCGDIVFTNPYPFRDRMPFEKITELNNPYYKVTPTNGKLLLWPSSLNHQTETNVSEGHRMSISLDVFYVSANLLPPLKQLLDSTNVS